MYYLVLYIHQIALLNHQHTTTMLLLSASSSSLASSNTIVIIIGLLEREAMTTLHRRHSFSMVFRSNFYGGGVGVLANLSRRHQEDDHG